MKNIKRANIEIHIWNGIYIKNYPLDGVMKENLRKKSNELLLIGEGTIENFPKETQIDMGEKVISINFINRLTDYKDQIFVFMHYFDNNIAESDVGMIKIKQKIPGVFRNTDGADGFTRIRGYIFQKIQ